MNAKELGAQPITAQLLVMGEKAMSKGGITKRELFAAMCLRGYLSLQGWLPAAIKASPDDFQEKLADSAVFMADALLAELAKEQA